ncbi:putative methionine--tRNA ligase [Helianthus annuus]|uniref:Methionine--tRNA ligase n=1 Tax=Helianthus annuus TaxID=4232 RepID=A0A9K3HQL4_HELAN|nr:putative methionine--tRNA ligase [Helianthus annuus]KAJ0502173.1 putative methionine--tRNA ligase [Helianthus annuus]KAJ0510152.1 putative methionine--tRNA ligase [Helianthus annuus]KAJ0518095.1 putative methionine--tRNA ligase [Helianthus annuus]KAJ0686121.1 putative methionine--tRNA ligase [Helianthus annuus]
MWLKAGLLVFRVGSRYSCLEFRLRVIKLYCDTCQKFLVDRLVEGSCPTPCCHYDSAQGDQCEKCGKLLNPTELVNPRCKVCANSPHICDTNHLFLQLPLLEGNVRDYISSMSVARSWSQNAIQATNVWLKEGLTLCSRVNLTRDKKRKQK